MQLQKNLGTDVKLGATLNGPGWASVDVGRLGASGTLLGLVACSAAAGRDGP